MMVVDKINIWWIHVPNMKATHYRFNFHRIIHLKHLLLIGVGTFLLQKLSVASQWIGCGGGGEIGFRLTANLGFRIYQKVGSIIPKCYVPMTSSWFLVQLYPLLLIKIRNFHFCFCSIDLSCLILEKKIFSKMYILYCVIKGILNLGCFFYHYWL